MRLNETNDFDFWISITVNQKNIMLSSRIASLQRDQESQYDSKHHIPHDHLISFSHKV